MRHLLGLVAGFAVTGSIAYAEPDDARARHRTALRIEVEVVDGEEELEDDEQYEDDDEIVFEDGDVFDARVATRARRRPESPWHVAIGPYLWASSVDADVSLGSASVSTGADFMDIQRNAKYGATVLAEVRYRRFAVHGDVMYGVIALDGAKEVGPVMVTLDGTASSLMFDGTFGYLLAGAEPRAPLSLEARAGLRYQRTAIAGSVDLSGSAVSQLDYVDAAGDAVVGAHVVARPFRRLTLAGTADYGAYGDSTLTWSAAAEAGVRITDRVLLSLAWRTLTTQRANVSIVMHGPRAALQLTF